MSNNSQQQAGLIERLRLMELDHEPDSWPAIQMCDVSALLNELERRNYAGKMVAAMPVGELTLEQITRIYDRYGGDMVNCTRAIERELAAARSQPTPEESLVVAGAQPVREPLTDYSDTATIAGLESSVGHLSVMVDELRLMLGDAMNAMTELHSKVTPDEDTPNIDGIVPAAAYAKFVNAHADLLYRIHHSPHAGQLSRLPAAHGITKKGGES